MIYFDTDVLINYLVEQDTNKHQHAIHLVEDASKSGLFFCSLLCLQESAFVLSKLKVPDNDIEGMMMELVNFQTVNYTAIHYKRAIQLARQIGFQNINDCLHTALAESYCDELYTFNLSDFKKIKNFTILMVTIF